MSTTPTIFGRIQPPAIQHKDIDPALNTAWDNLGQRKGLFVVLHRMYGSLNGTDAYFRNEARERARTDYGIDAQSGAIYRWTDPLSVQAPYASGPYQSPSGDGPALVAKLGVYAINRDGISIEISGDGDDPVSTIAFERMAMLIAFWADWNGITHEAWPINPKTGLTFMYWHGEFNGQKRDTCPGPVVAGFTERLIERVRTILKTAQTATALPPIEKPQEVTPPPATVDPPTALALPQGTTLDQLKGWFGTVSANDERAMTFAFDPNGPVTRLWLDHGRETGEWPQLRAVGTEGNARFFRFEGGWTVRGNADGTATEVA